MGNVGVREEREGLVDFGQNGSDLEELTLAVLDVVAGDAGRLEELGAAGERVSWKMALRERGRRRTRRAC